MASSTFVAASGDGYELQMGRWSRRLAEPFLDFCGYSDGETVMDAGCGTGSLTFALAQRSKDLRIQGIDFSPAYVEHATQHNPNPNVAFRVGDVCALPFGNASFDRVLSLLVLHFVPDTNRAVSEMLRVARPGATVAAAVWDARGGVVAHRLFLDTAATLDQKGNENRARNCTRPTTRPGELGAAWHKAGFVDIRETMLTIRMEFASFDDYWAPYIGKDGPAAQYVASLSKTAYAILFVMRMLTESRMGLAPTLRSHGRLQAPCLSDTVQSSDRESGLAQYILRDIGHILRRRLTDRASARLRLWVKTGKAQSEQMFSA